MCVCVCVCGGVGDAAEWGSAEANPRHRLRPRAPPPTHLGGGSTISRLARSSRGPAAARPRNSPRPEPWRSARDSSCTVVSPGMATSQRSCGGWGYRSSSSSGRSCGGLVVGLVGQATRWAGARSSVAPGSRAPGEGRGSGPCGRGRGAEPDGDGRMGFAVDGYGVGARWVRSLLQGHASASAAFAAGLCRTLTPDFGAFAAALTSLPKDV